MGHMSFGLKLLLLVSFLKELVFISVLPIWHGPDEQAHFGQIANYVELGRLPTGPQNLNKEIYTSEVLLGTLRDKFGTNKFTYHPEYKIEYTSSRTGKYERQITTLPLTSRQELVINESTNYPPIYYWVGSLGYWLF